MAASDKKQAPKIISDRVKLGEYARNTHRVTPEQGATVDDMLEPGYWVHVASKFRVGDIVEVFPEGGAWFTTFLVVSQSNVHLKLVVLTSVRLSEEQKAAAKNDAPYKIEHKGSIHKWSVIRASDKSYVKDGFDTKEEASAWLAENEADLSKE
jgi:hypothetical protein